MASNEIYPMHVPSFTAPVNEFHNCYMDKGLIFTGIAKRDQHLKPVIVRVGIISGNY